MGNGQDVFCDVFVDVCDCFGFSSVGSSLSASLKVASASEVACLNSLMALAAPRANSGNRLAPNNSSTTKTMAAISYGLRFKNANVGRMDCMIQT